MSLESLFKDFCKSYSNGDGWLFSNGLSIMFDMEYSGITMTDKSAVAYGNNSTK